MKKQIILTITIFLILLKSSNAFALCIAASDFGFFENKVVDPTGYCPVDEYGAKECPLQEGNIYKQYSEWKDSKLRTRGDDLVIQVDGSWTSWYTGSTKRVKEVCEYENGDPEKIKNPPCWLVGGYGVYIRIGEENDPDASVYHLGNQQINTLFKTKTNLFTGIDDEGKAQFDKDIDATHFTLKGPLPKDKKIYYKIYDTIYADNAVGYDSSEKVRDVKLIFKQGYRKNDVGILEKMVSGILTPLRNAMENIFNHIVGSDIYQTVFYVSLVLLFTILGIMVSLGMVGFKGEPVMLMFKISVVVALVSPTSWGFFNKYVADFFLDGADHISSIALDSLQFNFGQVYDTDGLEIAFDPNQQIAEDSANASSDKEARLKIFAAIDDMLRILYSKEVYAKVMALFLHSSGFPINLLYMIGVYVAILLFTYAVLKATFIYIIIYLMMVFLLSTAPLFLLFFLFKSMNYVFANWLREIISLAMQPILLFAFIGMMMSVLMSQFIDILYYEVCQVTWLKLGFKTIRAWQPQEHIELNFGDLFLLGMLTFILMSLMKKVPAISSGLAGGGAIKGDAIANDKPHETLKNMDEGLEQFTKYVAQKSTKVTGRAVLNAPRNITHAAQRTRVGRQLSAMAPSGGNLKDTVLGKMAIPGTRIATDEAMVKRAKSAALTELKREGYTEKEIEGKLRDRTAKKLDEMTFGKHTYKNATRKKGLGQLLPARPASSHKQKDGASRYLRSKEDNQRALDKEFFQKPLMKERRLLADEAKKKGLRGEEAKNHIVSGMQNKMTAMGISKYDQYNILNSRDSERTSKHMRSIKFRDMHMKESIDWDVKKMSMGDSAEKKKDAAGQKMGQAGSYIATKAKNAGSKIFSRNKKNNDDYLK